MTQSSDDLRTANLLGAAALAAADRTARAADAATGRPTTDTAALVSLHTTLGGGSQELLRGALNLTQSGAVRLVNRLEREGLITRSAGRNGRTHALTLTPSGTAAAQDAIRARADTTAALLAPLNSRERAQLSNALAKLLAGLADDLETAHRMCRLCDPDVCGHSTGRCPVTEATAPAAVGTVGV